MFGLSRDGDLIGALDLLRDYPEPDDWYLGLLLIEPRARGAGLGARVFVSLKGWVEAQGGRAIRLAVQDQNQAGARFWIRMGFQPVGAAVQALENQTNQVTQMELRL